MKDFGTVAIVGVGLIGGSVGLALRQRALCERVIGIGRRQASLRIARRVGAITSTTVDLAKGVAEADLVLVCTPVGQIVDLVCQVAHHCPEGTLITDAGSVKQTLVEALDDRLSRGCRFLGGHPLAGSERGGPGNATSDLFEGRVAILTPTRSTRAEDFDLLNLFWSKLGSVVIQMTAEDHDRAVAMTSHLPHAVAAALAAAMPETYFRLAGTGVLDTTRIAGGDPVLWGQIFALNRGNVLAALDRFAGCVSALGDAIRKGDQAALEGLLKLAKKNRDALGS
jgi:prephenate dehydrogenase